MRELTNVSRRRLVSGGGEASRDRAHPWVASARSEMVHRVPIMEVVVCSDSGSDGGER